MSIRIGGPAGSGIQTIGYALAKAFLRGGQHVFAAQDYQSRIRGGHNYFQVRVSDKPIYASSAKIDILIALDLETIKADTKDLKSGGIILFDNEVLKELPPEKSDSLPEGDRLSGVPFERLAKEKGGNKLYMNSTAVGAAVGLIGFDFEIVSQVIKESFHDKEAAVQDGNIQAAKAGLDATAKSQRRLKGVSFSIDKSATRMLISGSDALALGALRAGVKFHSGYPMTPSTGIMTYLAEKGRRLGVVVEQAEDEISAINMALGASFAGVRAMTATSGGGFDLMVEGLSLAGMTETPLVIVEAQRPGPSTGLPTRTEQGDLEFMVHAGHGEFPRAVFAPRTIEDAYTLMIKAFDIAEKYQTQVIVMSDQHLADSYRSVDSLDIENAKIERYLISTEKLNSMSDYNRHALTVDGVSPRAYPLQGNKCVVSDSDEHTEDGHLTEDLDIRVKMSDKRMKKLEGIKKEISQPLVYGDKNADITFLGWGSSYGAIKEAVDILNGKNVKASMIHLNEIYPIPENLFAQLKSAKRIVDVENNATGQLAHLIQAETGFEIKEKMLQYNGRPFLPETIIKGL